MYCKEIVCICDVTQILTTEQQNVVGRTESQVYLLLSEVHISPRVGKASVIHYRKKTF
jgi:hypothetical protein